MAVVTAAPAKASDKHQAKSAPVPLVPFSQAADEHIEDVFDVSKTPTASTQNLGTIDVPAFGYLRALVLLVTATGGAGGNAVAKADAPFSALASVEVDDTNGQPFFGPVSGFDAYLIDKWLSARPSDPKARPAYTAMDTSGNFKFLLRIPVEIIPRTGLGSLSNMNAASTYKVKVSLADTGSIWSTVPTTVPSVRVQCFAEEWTEPLPADTMGRGQETEPPALGTTQEYSTQDININAGSQNPRLTRVGNTIRAWIFVGRDGTGARSDSVLSDPFDLMWDGRNLARYHLDHLRSLMYERYPTGYTRDTGVHVVEYAHDFDGRVGDELQEGYLQTGTGSRIELQGANYGAGTLHVITNDILAFAGPVA